MIKFNVYYPGNRHVVIYHAACADGFCAALLLHEAFINTGYTIDILLIPAHYNQPLPEELKPNDVVFLVDFSYKYPVMCELIKKVEFVYVLDHHKTAKEELAQLGENIFINFNMDKSGAMLAFDFVNTENDEIPELVKYVQDRDLWKFELPYSREISAYLRSIEFDLKVWGSMLDNENWSASYRDSVKEGMAILRFQRMQIQSAADKAVDFDFPIHPDSMYGMPIKIVNTTVNHSEVGEELCTRFDIPFAVTWFQRGDGMFQYSLRSHGGYDVSKVAKNYGGGGHPSAAGFESRVLISNR